MNQGSVPYPGGVFAKFINSLMDVQQVGGLAGELIETFELMKWTERGRVVQCSG